MPQSKVSVSLFNRWNNASLDTSIASLYPSGETPKTGRNTSGSPEGDAVPRAEYMVSMGDPIKSRGSRQYTAVVTFEVWGTLKETVDGYVTSIYNAFVNCSESSVASPIAMSGGDIQEVSDGAAFVEKEDDAVFRGTQIIYIRFSVPQQVPA